jgi:hypothetical protein
MATWCPLAGTDITADTRSQSIVRSTNGMF